MKPSHHSSRMISPLRPPAPGLKLRRRASAFTLIELLVAIGVMLILLVVIGRIFTDIGNASSLFAANSQVTDYAGALGQALRNDIRQINHDGFMVIKTRSVRSDQSQFAPYVTTAGSPTYRTGEINYTNGNAANVYPIYTAYTTTSAHGLAASSNPEPMRTNTDMLMFFANGPWTSQRYDSSAASAAAVLSRTIQAPVARVIYGHLASNCSVTTTNQDKVYEPEYGPRHDVQDPLVPPVSIVEGYDLIPSSQWILGRHVTLLVPSSTPTAVGTDFRYAPTSLWMGYGTPTGTSGDYAAIGTPTIPNLVTPTAIQGLRNGLWDVAYNSNLLDIRTAINNTSLTLTSPGYIGLTNVNQYYAAASSTTVGASFCGSANWTASALTSDIPYRMADTCYRAYGTRSVDPTIANSNVNVEIMQTTAALAPYCSNFQVEFAGSYADPTKTAGVDRENQAAGTTLGDPVTYNDDPTSASYNANWPIYWYGGIQMVDRAVGSGPTIDKGRRRIVIANGPNAAQNLNMNIFINKFQPGSTAATFAPALASPLNALSVIQPNSTDNMTGGTGNLGRREYTAVFGYDRSVSPWPRYLRITATFHDDKQRFRTLFISKQNITTGISQVQDGRTYQWVIEVPQ